MWVCGVMLSTVGGYNCSNWVGERMLLYKGREGREYLISVNNTSVDQLKELTNMIMILSMIFLMRINADGNAEYEYACLAWLDQDNLNWTSRLMDVEIDRHRS